MIFEIEGRIISSDIFEVKFCCDIAACRGACCVEGNSGAPLEAEEVGILEEGLDIYRPYMKRSGIEAVETQGVMVIDGDGDFTTPLINDAECAYSFESGGVTLCAIERAYLEGKTKFRKPVSCHLYPLRVVKFSNGTYGINYHRWDICDAALALGENKISDGKKGIPLYKALREPIIRKFGRDFYSALEGFGVEAGFILNTNPDAVSALPPCEAVKR